MGHPLVSSFVHEQVMNKSDSEMENSLRNVKVMLRDYFIGYLAWGGGGGKKNKEEEEDKNQKIIMS